MRNFFSSFFACLLAFIVGGFVVFVVSITMVTGIVGSMMGSFGTTADTKISGNVLKIDFAEVITDQPSSSMFGVIDLISMNSTPQLSLMEVISAIEQAETDPAIKAIYLAPVMNMSVGTAKLQEIRQALHRFKTNSGKMIYGYGEFLSQGGFYICSVADYMCVNPAGGISWSGLSSEVVFFKGLFDKFGVEPEVFRCGEFKSAVEPYINTTMSPENRLQTEMFLNSIWGGLVADISTSIRVDSAKIQQLASDLALSDVKNAVTEKMITKLAYEDEVIDLIKEDIDEEVKFIPFHNYAAGLGPISKSSNHIAIIYADGEIVSGKSNEGTVGAETIVGQLKKIKEDDKVKAVVFRINSPGGSALASDVIWREVSLLQKQKPVVVSMGDYAASGGYYIAAPADAILAMPATLTGSIGVFGLSINASKGMRDELGITSEKVATNPSAGGGSLFTPISQAQRISIQSQVDQTYAMFVDHVAQGRNMTNDKVLAIAGGRVWSGVDANRIGLVDMMGGLVAAISVAADKAGIAEDYSIVTPFSAEVSFLSSLMNIQSKVSAEETFLTDYKRLKAFMSAGETQIQALMPYRVWIN